MDILKQKIENLEKEIINLGLAVISINSFNIE
jgi:hypothetical protein